MYRVLVVDDKPSQTDLLCAMLSFSGIDCLVAHTGIDAVNLAKHQQPDLIIMDWVMPMQTLNGNDATRKILADSETHNIPIIACSAIADLNDAVAVGCVDRLHKPFGRELLMTTINQYLN